MYPCRAGPGNLQSRAVAAEAERITEFSSPVPAFLKQVRERANPFPLSLRFEVVSGSLGGLWVRHALGLPHPRPRRWQDRPGTYEAAKHGAGDAGGQAHGRGLSGPAHMSPEPLRCPPAPGARCIPAAGARLMQPRPQASAQAPGPSLCSRAPLPSSPQWSGPGSALRQERGREGSPATGALRTPPGRWRRRRRQRQRGSRARAPPAALAPPAPQPGRRGRQPPPPPSREL